MRPTLVWLFCGALLALSFSCSNADKEKANQRAAETRQKTHEETERLQHDARQLGHEAKQEAKSLDQKINQALTTPGSAGNGTTAQADEKLRRGGEDLRVAGDQAGVKLSRAAMIAKVKTKLATDVGLSTITGVDVNASGQVVTLRGTVSSEQQKQQAEQAVLQLGGVTRVVNELRVKP